MAHSCRWRFPARPGTTGGGGGGGRRGLGGAPRQRVPALLLPPGPAGGGAPGAPPSPSAVAAGSGGAAAAVGAAAASAAPSAPASSSAPSSSAAPAGPALLRVGPGFDAALQVSAAIGTNLRRFRAVFGESGGGGGSGEVRRRGTPARGPDPLRGLPSPTRAGAHPDSGTTLTLPMASRRGSPNVGSPAPARGLKPSGRGRAPPPAFP